MATDNSDATQSRNAKEDQQLEQMIAQAAELAAKGENVEQLLEVILESFPSQVKDKLRKKFSAALAKRGVKEKAPDGEIAPRGAFGRIRDMLALSAKQAMERVTALVRSRPDVAKAVAQAGIVLMKNGVAVDRIQLSEGASVTPSAVGVGQAAQKQETRGA